MRKASEMTWLEQKIKRRSTLIDVNALISSTLNPKFAIRNSQ